jgi:hypothetical protein
MTFSQLQETCEAGQRELVRTEYLRAERLLEEAEGVAWAARDFDTLARLYMPLQEARRQRRLRCGEGTVCLDLVAQGPTDHVDGKRVIENYPFGQLLVAGWGTIEPATRLRQLQREHELYVETFLGAVYPTTDRGHVVVVVPHEGLTLPGAEPRSYDQLKAAAPMNSLLLRVDELPSGPRKGTTQTYAQVMDIWEALYLPFLKRADAEADLLRRVVGYRKTIEVDYACELAHQNLSKVAHELDRTRSCARA